MSEIRKSVIKILMPVMSKMTPTCNTITQKISESQDRKISLKDRIGIRIHLMGCNFCRRYEQQLIIMRKMIAEDLNNTNGSSTEMKLSPDARQRIQQQINKKIKP